MNDVKSTPESPDAGPTDLPSPSGGADGPSAPERAAPPDGPPPPPALTPDPALALLEQRVRRLEDGLAQLQSRAAAERITDRPAPPPVAAPAPPPLAAPAALLELGKRLVAPVPAVAPPAAAPARRAWLLTDTLADLRAMTRMYFDPRYKMSWAGWLVPAGLLVAFLTTQWWPLASIPVVGWLVNKVLDLVLLFALFKVLSHEARRYRETAPDLPPHLRL